MSGPCFPLSRRAGWEVPPTLRSSRWQVLTVTAGFSEEDVCSWEKCCEVY